MEGGKPESRRKIQIFVFLYFVYEVIHSLLLEYKMSDIVFWNALHVCLLGGFTSTDLEEEIFSGEEWGQCDYISDKVHRALTSPKANLPLSSSFPSTPQSC